MKDFWGLFSYVVAFVCLVWVGWVTFFGITMGPDRMNMFDILWSAVSKLG